MHSLNTVSELWGERPIASSNSLPPGNRVGSGFEQDSFQDSPEVFSGPLRPDGPDIPVCCWNFCGNYAGRKVPRPAVLNNRRAVV